VVQAGINETGTRRQAGIKRRGCTQWAGVAGRRESRQAFPGGGTVLRQSPGRCSSSR